jgi:hypothetical protein
VCAGTRDALKCLVPAVPVVDGTPALGGMRRLSRVFCVVRGIQKDYAD